MPSEHEAQCEEAHKRVADPGPERAVKGDGACGGKYEDEGGDDGGEEERKVVEQDRPEVAEPWIAAHGDAPPQAGRVGVGEKEDERGADDGADDLVRGGPVLLEWHQERGDDDRAVDPVREPLRTSSARPLLLRGGFAGSAITVP